MYPVFSVDPRGSEVLEPLGTKPKFWFTAADGRRILFKAEERGTGEDWAEKIACELAALLGLPHVHYDLASNLQANVPGVVCPNLLSSGQHLAHGNQLLLAIDSSYPAQGKRFGVSEHTIDMVAKVLDVLYPPVHVVNAPDGVETALHWFVGYVLLDAWIANQDRHHENWAAVLEFELTPEQEQRPRLSLSPTFDHGASMARNISNEERQERLTTRDRQRQLPAFTRKARSAFYVSADSNKSLTTVAAYRAFAELAPAAARAWETRLKGIADDEVRRVIDEVPPERMSAICREFTLYLLRENRARILNGEPE